VFGGGCIRKGLHSNIDDVSGFVHEDMVSFIVACSFILALSYFFKIIHFVRVAL
jgi:uncharacterized protein YcsI (UPF0317 family)